MPPPFALAAASRASRTLEGDLVFRTARGCLGPVDLCTLTINDRDIGWRPFDGRIPASSLRIGVGRQRHNDC